jgi:pimeloyl-ACP methyl ester carboxylesterase
MPAVKFARSGDVSIAYSVVGDGPIDLVYAEGSFTHLEVEWDLPAYRAWCERLGEFCRVIRFDKRGMGMSDRVGGATTLETRMDDIRAVMDAVGSERAAILGESEGGPLALLFAAAHPERTRALILQGAEVCERKSDDWPWGEATDEQFEGWMATLPDRWGRRARAQTFAPSIGDAEWADDFLVRLRVNSGTPTSAEAFLRMAHEIDVRAIVPTIHVPALVLHSVGDRICHVENGRFLARALPNARYVEMPGDDHTCIFEPDRVIAEIREFLTGVRESVTPERALATVLFTDIVDSTATAAQLGDRRWREQLEAHRAAARRAIAAHRGREVDTAGDGFLVTFDGPARAIRCAREIAATTAPLGLRVRAGVHTGEVELLGEKVAGIAVHIGARVAAAAGPDEVWVSGTVRDLVAGSGLAFEDRGTRELKGVPGEWRLFSVAS